VPKTLARRLVAEGFGTAFLLAAVVGSGIMGERLAEGNAAVALLANTLATGTALVALILRFGPVSGAHFNPAVTLAQAWEGSLPRRDVVPYVAVQFLGGIAGVALAHAMFGEPLFSLSLHARQGWGQFLSEFIATAGLLSVIASCARRQPAVVPFAVASYIMSAYWFTASTSFANPAATLARSLTNTFAGIRPSDVPAFLAAQVLGAGAATLLMRWLVPIATGALPRVVVSAAQASKEREAS
jgi:glycerol uptake facilitator-like aquaporin